MAPNKPVLKIIREFTGSATGDRLFLDQYGRVWKPTQDCPPCQGTGDAWGKKKGDYIYGQ